MNRDKLIILIFFLLVKSTGLYSQQILISKEKAISIALSNGLPIGLSDFEAELRGDSVWIVKSLLCEDLNEKKFEILPVDAKNGNVLPDKLFEFEISHMPLGGKIERTKIGVTNVHLDSLPVIQSFEDRKLTTLNENESNPVFSDNDEFIAFHYGFRKIGIISINGDQFQQICNECLYPQWLDNNWLMYFRDFEHIYKKNIVTGEEIRITENPYRYDNYQLSPDKRWIIYSSSEMWPNQDSLGNLILYNSMNGQGQNFCLISLDGKVKKYFDKKWECYYKPTWSPNGDTIYFYISDNKYIATDFSSETIKFYRYSRLQNLSLWEYEKINSGSFPFNYNCQVIDVNVNTLAPIGFLIKERGRYRDIYYSHNKRYLIYAKTDKKQGDYSLWIKRINY